MRGTGAWVKIDRAALAVLAEEAGAEAGDRRRRWHPEERGTPRKGPDLSEIETAKEDAK